MENKNLTIEEELENAKKKVMQKKKYAFTRKSKRVVEKELREMQEKREKEMGY